MNKRLILTTLCIVLVLIAAMSWKQTVKTEQTFSGATLRYGSSGSDIYELQGRLKFLGYYNGNIDGVFGSQTLRAVKDFQWKFGMKVDGIAGAKTKLKLWEATKSWRPTAATAPKNPSIPPSSNSLGLSQNDINLMANAVYGEARGESYEGQVAVAAVILNRVKSSSFPNTVSGVIFQPGAFTAVSDGQIWLTPNATAKRAVQDAINGMNPVNNCLYYFNPATATSKWIWTRQQVKRIGKHIFCI